MGYFIYNAVSLALACLLLLLSKSNIRSIDNFALFRFVSLLHGFMLYILAVNVPAGLIINVMNLMHYSNRRRTTEQDIASKSLFLAGFFLYLFGSALVVYTFVYLRGRGIV